MTVPTVPFATDEDVAMFQHNLLIKTGAFGADTPLPKTVVDKYIDWVSAQVLLKFSEAGFVVPFTELSGETWPVHQTTYLQMLTCIGVSHLVSAGLKPAPAQGPGRNGSSESIFEKMFKEELNRIYDGKESRLRFRAGHYIGTPAEKAITEPISPKSDFMEELYDKSRYMGLSNYTEMMAVVHEDMVEDISNWDYIYDYIGMGYGY